MRDTHNILPGIYFGIIFLILTTAEAFQPTLPLLSRRCTYNLESQSTTLYSSIGGGSNGDKPPSSDSGWDDFLDPNKEESENLMRAREFVSDNSLPISYDKLDDDDDEDEDDDEIKNIKKKVNNANSSALVASRNDFTGGLSSEILSRNPYMAVVSKLSPSELISKFTSTAPSSVQNAVRSTILGLIGGLPKMAFETSTVTTGQKLASLMFQLQMTGYMFKNAEYRLSLQQSLGVDNDNLSIRNGKSFLLTGKVDKDDDRIDPLTGKIKGKLRIRYGNSNNNTNKTDTTSESVSSNEMEVDAAAYMSELRNEVKKLRDELSITRKSKEETMRKDLLMYIRTLPQQELQSLTNTMSQDVLIAMKGLVDAVMSGIGEGQIGPDTVTEQSGEAMAQLCMWQLVIGYNLRTLEVREEMKKSLTGSSTKSKGLIDDFESGIDHLPGTLE